MLIFFSSAELFGQSLGEAERYSELEGASVGECVLLLQVAIHRFAGGRPAAEIAAPLERIVANDELLAAIGPDAPWLPFLIGMLFKTDRLDAASRVTETALAEAGRVGSPGGFASASLWRAWIALRRGDGEAAEAHARTALDAAPPGELAARLLRCRPRRGAGRACAARRGEPPRDERRGVPWTSARSC